MIIMFNDLHIQEWIESHGTATSFTFVVFGDLKEEEVELLIKGVVIHLQQIKKYSEMAVFFDPIDEKQAVAWNTYQGTSLAFIFAGDASETENTIKGIILDGLNFLRYKCEYLGIKVSENYV
jgi:hypothetical protein|tara:strand:+ start:678 stop:1043 length:366 start_codon:yes stop_codon:yes gene_type:complete